jgi:hypothetical protein
MTREPHIVTPLQDRRPFEDYIPQPDTAERVRLAVQAIPLWLPERKKREEANGRDPVR